MILFYTLWFLCSLYDSLEFLESKQMIQQDISKKKNSDYESISSTFLTDKRYWRNKIKCDKLLVVIRVFGLYLVYWITIIISGELDNYIKGFGYFLEIWAFSLFFYALYIGATAPSRFQEKILLIKNIFHS